MYVGTFLPKDRIKTVSKFLKQFFYAKQENNSNPHFYFAMILSYGTT